MIYDAHGNEIHPANVRLMQTPERPCPRCKNVYTRLPFCRACTEKIDEQLLEVMNRIKESEHTIL